MLHASDLARLRWRDPRDGSRWFGLEVKPTGGDYHTRY